MPNRRPIEKSNLPVIVLAGGLGTRMGSWTKTIPKHLIPVNGVPFSDYQLKWFAAHGVTDVIFSIGYKGEAIRDFVGDGSQYGLRATYVEDGDKLLGTGGAVRRCAERFSEFDSFLITYGDSFLRVDFREVYNHFENSGFPVLMTVLRNDGALEPSNVVYANGRVELYDKKREHPNPKMCWIDYGLLAARRTILLNDIPADEVCDLARFQNQWSIQGKIAGFPVSHRFFEVGSPLGLAEFEEYLSAANQGIH